MKPAKVRCGSWRSTSASAGVQQEDPRPAVAERAQGTAAAEAARSGGSGDPASAATVAVGGAPAAGYDFGRAPTTNPAEQRGRTGPFLALGLAAAAGIKPQKSLRAQEQESAENLWRQRWWEPVSQVDPACLVLLDESGVTTEMTRRYGWAPRPERV